MYCDARVRSDMVRIYGDVKHSCFFHFRLEESMWNLTYDQRHICWTVPVCLWEVITAPHVRKILAQNVISLERFSGCGRGVKNESEWWSWLEETTVKREQRRKKNEQKCPLTIVIDASRTTGLRDKEESKQHPMLHAFTTLFNAIHGRFTLFQFSMYVNCPEYW